MLQVTYNYYGEVRTVTINPTEFYVRGKGRLVFEDTPFHDGKRWVTYSVIVRRKSVRFEKAIGHTRDRMFGSSVFKVYSIKNI